MAKKINLSDLVSLPYNPRVIDKEEMERLKASIKRHTTAISEKDREGGYRLINSITVNKQGNRIVGGNQRVQALKDLKQDWILERDITWVDVPPDSVQEKEMAISLNRKDAGGRWDDEKLAAIMDELKVGDEEGFELLDMDNLEKELELAEPIDGFAARSRETAPSGPPLPKSGSGSPPSEDSDEDDKPVPDKFKGEPGSERTDLPKPPPPPPPAEPEDDSAPMLFPISYAVTGDQRKVILDAIAKARTQLKTETSADALTAICDQYLKG